MNNQEINELIATKIMGYELLTCGYVGTDSETNRQKELDEWMDRNELFRVGDYYINVEYDFWISADKFNPIENSDDAFQVLENFRDGLHEIEISIGEDIVWVDIIDLIRDNNQAHCNLYRASDKDLNMCICKSALLTVGIDLEEIEN